MAASDWFSRELRLTFPRSPRSLPRSLSVEEFTFYGFDHDDSIVAIERRLRGLTVRGGEPALTTHEGAVFVPSRSRRDGQDTKRTGTLLAADGRPIAHAQVSRRGQPLATFGDDLSSAVPGDEVREEVIYLGPLYNHFGRVLLDSLARSWALAQHDPSLKVLFDYPNVPHRHLHPWVFRILEAFGVPRARLLILDRPTRLRRVTVPEPLFEQGLTAHERAIGPYRDIAARIAGGHERSSQPVYLSRRLLTSRQRPIIGEEALEQLFADHGALIVHPQRLTFDQQVRLVNQHSDIFSSASSAAHNILFARHRPTLHLLTASDQIPANMFLCSALARAPTVFVDCLGTGGRPSFEEGRAGGRGTARRAERKGAAFAAPGGQATPQLVDLAKVATYLAGRDGGAPPSSPPPAETDPARDAEYTEAWLYAFIRRTGSNRGAHLPKVVEDEACSLADRSWPLCWILGRYYGIARDDLARASAMINRFADLVSTESDEERLNYFREDVVGMSDRVARRIAPAAADRLRRAAGERFPPTTFVDAHGAFDERVE